ncbi:MAG: hypothetical protein K2L80_08470 [Muribaculaceae bacterium]|nr:hypothetical protein [Muribaculaceae bacterium]
MSKARLKKELEGMTREQLIDIVLNVYTARKEAREYFEFFLDPDCEKLLYKYIEMIRKEVSRSKRGSYAKFKISAIKRMIKDFEGFDPGAEYVLKLRVYTFSAIMMYSRLLYYSDTQDNAAVAMARSILEYSDTHCLYDRAARTLSDILADENASAPYLRQFVRNALEPGV